MINQTSKYLILPYGNSFVYAPLSNCAFMFDDNGIFIRVIYHTLTCEDLCTAVGQDILHIKDLQCKTFEELMVALGVHMLIYDPCQIISDDHMNILNAQSSELRKLKTIKTELETKLANIQKSLEKLLN